MNDYTESTGKEAFIVFKSVLDFCFGSNDLKVQFDQGKRTFFVYSEGDVCCSFATTNDEEWESLQDFFKTIQAKPVDVVKYSLMLEEAEGTGMKIRVGRVLQNLMHNNGNGSSTKKKKRCSFM